MQLYIPRQQAYRDRSCVAIDDAPARGLAAEAYAVRPDCSLPEPREGVLGEMVCK
jgi:hypothetical protein